MTPYLSGPAHRRIPLNAGAQVTSREPHPDETAHRERLQRALGESYALGRLLGRAAVVK